MTERKWRLSEIRDSIAGDRHVSVINELSSTRQWEVAMVYIDDDDPETLADARLIVAAPKLLKALKDCMALIERDYAGYDAIKEWQQEAVKAITTAETGTVQ
jgi:hypothetical protein